MIGEWLSQIVLGRPEAVEVPSVSINLTLISHSASHQQFSLRAELQTIESK